MPSTLLGAAGLAVTAYLNGKYNLAQDLIAIRERRKVNQLAVKLERTKRWSPFYAFEDQANRIPNAPCIWYRIDPSQPVIRYTFRETYEQVCKWSTFLLEKGVQPGQLVAAYLQNSPEFMFNMAGCWAIGAAPALINYNLSEESLVHCLKVCGSRIVIVDDDAECSKRIEAVRGRIESELGMRIILLDAKTKAAIASQKMNRPSDVLREGVTAKSPTFLFYTSGSTGTPKACSFTMGRSLALTDVRLRSVDLKAHPNGDTWYNCMPFYHGTGCTTAYSCLIGGLTLAIGRKFSVRSFWQDIHDSQANSFVYVGETARYLLAAPPSPLDKTHKLKSAFGNGMRPDVFLRFKERFNIPLIHEFFNSTEGMFSLANECRNGYLATSVGHFGGILRLIYRNHYVPVRVDPASGDRIWRDPDTGFARRMSYDQGGEIIVRCLSREDFCGYWNNVEATSKRFEESVFTPGDLWYRTGDALRMDRDGRWSFVDRLGDTFRWKSENVSTAEVAEVLGRFPGLVEANVYGVEVPNADGRAGCAAIYVAPENRMNFDYAAFMAYARSKLPKYAVPVFLRLTESPTPMHNNKQNKVPLRAEGIELEKIRQGKAGPRDVMMWADPESSTYEIFDQGQLKKLVAGQVRL